MADIKIKYTDAEVKAIILQHLHDKFKLPVLKRGGFTSALTTVPVQFQWLDSGALELTIGGQETPYTPMFSEDPTEGISADD